MDLRDKALPILIGLIWLVLLGVALYLPA